ncbi:MAG: glycosyltransferase family 9 protein [Methylocella sp.]
MTDFDLSAHWSRLQKSLSRLTDQLGAVWQRRTFKTANDAEEASASGKGHEATQFTRPMPMRSGKEPSERIVIYRLGSLGDTVVALPCFHKVAEVFPNAERYVLTNSPVSSKAAPLETILRGSGLIEGIIDYPVQLRSVRHLWDLARRLKRLKASTLVYLAPPRKRLKTYRDLVFLRLCGFKQIIGAPTWKDEQDDLIDPATGLFEYECQRLVRGLAALGPIDLERRSNWDLRLTGQEREAGGKAIAPFNARPFIAINMGGKVVENHWGQDNWRRLFVELASTHGAYGLFVVGAAEESSCVSEITKGWPSAVVNACGRLMPRESAAALAEASLFIGHNSGPMHLAAACGIVCVAPFGDQNPPRTWHPYGSGHRIIHHMEGIATIGVDDMAAAVREALPALADVNSKL